MFDKGVDRTSKTSVVPRSVAKVAPRAHADSSSIRSGRKLQQKCGFSSRRASEKARLEATAHQCLQSL